MKIKSIKVLEEKGITTTLLDDLVLSGDSKKGYNFIT